LSIEASNRPEIRPELRPELLETRVLALLAEGPLSKLEIAARIGQKEISGGLKKIITTLRSGELIEWTIPERPNSKFQKCQITVRGRAHV
jgi:ATP-dependent DNA helicase RecG